MNVIGSDGWNAMHFACYLGHNVIVEHFINKKANVNKLSLEGYSPLQLAIKKNYPEAVKLLLNC